MKQIVDFVRDGYCFSIVKIGNIFRLVVRSVFSWEIKTLWECEDEVHLYLILADMIREYLPYYNDEEDL